MKACICHLSSVHRAHDVRILLKEGVSLARAGFDTHFVVRADADETFQGVTIHALPLAPGGRLGRMLFTTWRLFRTAISLDADIYHFHDPELIPIGLLLKWRGHRVIYDAHEDTPRQVLAKHWVAAPLRRLVAWAVEGMEDFAIRRLDGVCTATPHIAQRFSRLNNNTIDINNFPFTDEFVPEADWETREDRLCFIGGLSHIRGLDTLVDSLASSRLPLSLAGPVESADFLARLRASPGWMHVDYPGNLTRPEVSALLSRCKIGVVTFLPLPNHVDAQPNKLFEYMSAGLPVIASDFPLWRELVEGNGCGLCVDPEDAEAIANIARWLIDNDALAKQMGEQGRRMVLEKYNWQCEEKKLLAFYQQLLATPPTRTARRLTP